MIYFTAESQRSLQKLQNYSQDSNLVQAQVVLTHAMEV